MGSLGPGISLPAASAMAVDEGRTYGMGTIMSVFMLGMSIGMAIGPVVCGVVADVLNVSSVFYFASGMGLILTILFIS